MRSAYRTVVWLALLLPLAAFASAESLRPRAAQILARIGEYAREPGEDAE